LINLWCKHGKLQNDQTQLKHQRGSNSIESGLTRDFLGMSSESSRPFLPQDLAKFASISSAMSLNHFTVNPWWSCTLRELHKACFKIPAKTAELGSVEMVVKGRAARDYWWWPSAWNMSEKDWTMNKLQVMHVLVVFLVVFIFLLFYFLS
jgi:hypothetical protein